jgi:hypothetical protein
MPGADRIALTTRGKGEIGVCDAAADGTVVAAVQEGKDASDREVHVWKLD